MSLASSESRAASVQVASASSSSSGLSGLFGSWFASKPENQKTESRPAQPAAEAPAAKPKATAAAKPTQVAKVKPETTTAADTKNATGSSKAKAGPEREEANAEPKPGSGTSSLLNGAAPTVPSGGFEGRFGAWQH
jgi:hypothetical protein